MKRVLAVWCCVLAGCGGSGSWDGGAPPPRNSPPVRVVAGAAGAGVVEGAAAASPVFTSLPALDGFPCADPRLPALAGGWAVGCGPGGVVDRAVNLATGRTATLARPARQVALASDGSPRLFALGAGVWTLPESPGGDVVVEPAGVWPAANAGALGATVPRGLAFSGAHVAVALSDGVDLYDGATRARVVTKARPLGEIALVEARGPPDAPVAPAVLAAWVERGEDGTLDLWGRGPDGRRVPLAVGPSQAWRPVAAGARLSWVEDGDVVTLDLRDGSRTRVEADAGFTEGLAAWGDVVCWADRARLRARWPDGDVDLRCSDGLDLARPGDQRGVARGDGWILFREGGRVRVGRPETPGEPG